MRPPAAVPKYHMASTSSCSARVFANWSRSPVTMFTTPGFTDEKIHLFLATGLTAGESNREADEFLELVPTRLSRALSMVEQGEIQDAKTALALLYAAGFRLG